MPHSLTLTAAAGFLLSATLCAHAQEVSIIHETSNGANAAAPADIPADGAGVVELAICLDTSGSMDGLINAARQKLWSIVNELALAKPTPKLRVALLTYGNDGHNPENGWVQVNTPFTEDLDKVSEMLFALSTNGGTELVARVIHSSIEELDWTNSDDALKLIVVAGNESANQDQQFSYKDVCKQAISMGVMVNSIYCVYSGDGPQIAGEWEEVAQLADGQFGTIDQNNAAVVIATPVDDAIIELSSRLNATYIPFGSEGVTGSTNQWAQDNNALLMNKAAAASRAQTKGGALYGCSWDLVDACYMFEQNIEDVKEEDLPENLRAMTMEERKQYVADMKAKRETIQEQINKLNAERQRYVMAEQSRQSERGVDQFDLIIRTAVRDQARAKGFEMAAAEADAAAAPATMPYFVQYGDIWVAASFIDEYEQTRQLHRVPAPDVEIEEGGEAYKAFIAQLDEKMRAALESIEAATVVMKVDGKVYEITMAAPQPVENNVNAAVNDRSQMRQTSQTLQQVGQQVVQQRGQQQQQQEQQEGLPAIDIDPAVFVQRGDLWIDATYSDEYDAIITRAGEPTFDETIENTPQGREALLQRMSEPQREVARRLFDRMLEYFGGGIVLRIEESLVYLPFGC